MASNTPPTPPHRRRPGSTPQAAAAAPRCDCPEAGRGISMAPQNGVLGVELCLPKRDVGVLTPSASECGLAWRWGLYRGDRAIRRSVGRALTPAPHGERPEEMQVEDGAVLPHLGRPRGVGAQTSLRRALTGSTHVTHAFEIGTWLFLSQQTTFDFNFYFFSGLHPPPPSWPQVLLECPLCWDTGGHPNKPASLSEPGGCPKPASVAPHGLRTIFCRPRSPSSPSGLGWPCPVP